MKFLCWSSLFFVPMYSVDGLIVLSRLLFSCRQGHRGIWNDYEIETKPALTWRASPVIRLYKYYYHMCMICNSTRDYITVALCIAAHRVPYASIPLGAWPADLHFQGANFYCLLPANCQNAVRFPLERGTRLQNNSSHWRGTKSVYSLYTKCH
jgi:hypothetical protein